MSFLLIIVPAWIASIAVGGLWLAVGVFWSVDKWQATHDGIQGRFIPQVEDCGPKECHWRGDFVSDDGTDDVEDVQFSSAGEPQPQETGAAIEPVVIAPGGSDVYNAHDRSWGLTWVMVATAPLLTAGLIAGAHQTRADWLRKKQASEAHPEPVAALTASWNKSEG
ncbi:hypothetical protein GCM10009809_25860 [Isoptericola hypogeus]|uniref:Uncharacterized protein n=1 Tax=Isoptericola hypogeus TaxID=300179 RepID=A0ABN2JJ98_9MICO